MKFRLRIVLRTATLGLSAVWFAKGSLFGAAEVPVNLPPSRSAEILVISPVVSAFSQNDEYYRGVESMGYVPATCGREEDFSKAHEVSADRSSKSKFPR